MKSLRIGGVGLAILFGAWGGQAHAERPPCSGTRQIEQGYTIEQRWETSVDCAKRRNLRVGLAALAEDFSNGSNGAPKDWRRAVEAYELIIETTSSFEVQTLGAKHREVAFNALIDNFSTGNPSNGWPRDLARAEAYAKHQLRLAEQPNKPEFAASRTSAINNARKRLIDVGHDIQNEAKRALRPGDTFRDIFHFGEGRGPEMVVIPPGSFTKGYGTMEDFQIFAPAHRVDIRYRFAVGRYEVTQADWAPCVQDGKCKEIGGDSEKIPVERVSWDDAQVFIAWLNEKLRLTGRADRYRLLTESEWEYVARAGTTTRFFFGDDRAHLEDYATTFFSREEGPWGMPEYPEPVGTKRPNPFGLYDIYGNVEEWVEDCSNDRYYGNSPRDGTAFRGSNGVCAKRVLRGGSYRDSLMTSYTRKFAEPRNSWGPTGLRLARTIPD